MQHMNDRRPTYRRLRDEIADQIGQNVWRPGETISTEAELASKYKVSVSTVRKAIDCLVDDGLIERIAGSGMFVRRPDFEHSFIRFTQCFGSAGDRRVPQSRIYKREALVGPSEVLKAMQLRKGTRLIQLFRLRIYEGVPVSHENIWLEEARFAPLLTMKKTQPKLLYPIYEELCGEVIACADEVISIDKASETDAELLGLSLGAPIVNVDRLALGYNERPIEWRRSRSSATGFYYKVHIH